MEECMPPEGEELFTNNCGLPIRFSMPICPEKEEYRRKVEGHGGILTSLTGGHHTIHVVPPTLKTTSSTRLFDVFSTRYIDDCIHGEKLLSLESYRIGKSRYSSDISVNDIMMGIRSWKDCTLASRNTGEDVVFNDDDDMLPLPPKTKWKGRRDYEHRERRAILNYIIDKKKYHEVKGRNLWIDMEKAKVCPGRTWESMKEHFRRNIIHNLHIFRLDDKTLRRLTEPFVKERRAVKRRSPSDDSDDEVSSNEVEDNVSSKDVRNLDRDKKGNGRKELNANVFNRGVDGKITNENNSRGLTVQEKSLNSNLSLAPDGGNKKQENEQDASNKITTVERISQGSNEENSPPKMLKLADNSEGKCGESELHNSSDSTTMSGEEVGNEGKHDGGVTSDQSEAQIDINITVTQEVSEYGQNDNIQSKNYVPTSSGQSLPDVISSNSASTSGESAHEKFSNYVVTSDSGNTNTQAFDIGYSNEEFSANHSSLHLPNRNNKDHEKCNLPGHKNSENIDEDHLLHKNKEVASRCTESEDINENPSREQKNVPATLLTQKQTESVQASQNPVTRDEVISDNQNEHDEMQISTNHLTRKGSIQSPTTSRTKDANLSPESNVTSSGTFRKQNSRRKKNIKSPQSLRTSSNSVHRPRAEDDTSDFYGSPLSGTQSEGYESCFDQHHNEDTIQKETVQSKLERVDSDSSSTSRSSPHSVASTIIFPLPGRSHQGSRGNKVMRRKKRKRLINGSDSDNQRDQSESSDNEVVLRRNPHTNIFGNNYKNQKQANQREPEEDYVSGTTSSSDMEVLTQSCASNRNNQNGRYDRTFNPKSGCKEGDKKVNGKWGTARMRSKMPYTSTEDLKILKYIIKYKGYDQLGGNAFWKDMEASKTVPGRSWHSLKERYRMRIVHHLPMFVQYGINENHLRRLSSGAGEIRDDGNQSKNNSKNDSNSRKRPYTTDEDYLILKFINENKRHSQIGGKLMWVLMSESIEGLRGRTWLSLKERFRRTILKNLGSYQISDEERRKFMKSKERRTLGLKLYFKEEKTSSLEDEIFSSDGCVDNSTVRQNSGIGKRTRKSEEIRRGLESRRVIDKHLGMETKPSTSGYHPKNKSNKLMKRTLYTPSLVFNELPEKDCRSTQPVLPTIMPNKEINPVDTNENHMEKGNENIDDSQGESVEIPMLLGSQSLYSCSVSKSLNMNKDTLPVESVIPSEKVSENNVAVMDESVIVRNSSNFGKESEQETLKKDEVAITADHESQAFGTNSEAAITSDQESEISPSFELMSDISIKSQQFDRLSVEQNVKDSNVVSSPLTLGNKYCRISSASPGGLKKKRCWESSHLTLRSSSVRQKLRKRRIRHLRT